MEASAAEHGLGVSSWRCCWQSLHAGEVRGQNWLRGYSSQGPHPIFISDRATWI